MQTDKIRINNRGEGLSEVLIQAEKYSGYEGFDKKQSTRLRLMCEETVGMLRELTGEYSAIFWVEGENKATHLRLELQTEMDKEKRCKLLSVSSTGKNEFAKGIMGKIRDVISLSFMEDDLSDNLTDYDILMMGMNNAAMDPVDVTNPMAGYQIWSLMQYKDLVREKKEAYEAEWDELEKSIIANLADDVRIGIRDHKVHMEIFKQF
ncbi:MAG: hypothetical protein K6F86_08710 [Lachnospiraceae bacterium]|nr:hypothetical protein [Lachnospiraceae bacterium]